MLKEKLKSLHLSPFLIPLFICLHGINDCFVWVSFGHVLQFFMVIYVVMALYLFLSKLLFKTWIRAAVFTAFSLVIFFYFGFLQDGIKYIAPALSRTRYLLPISILLVYAAIVLIRKSRTNSLIKLNYFLNVLLCCLVAYELIGITCNSITKHREALQYQTNDEDCFSSNQWVTKPDIYFIVFDEYASSKVLQEHFSYKNQLDSFLLNEGFFVASNAKSNYAATPFSIASTLNMSYFEKIERANYPEDFPAACDAMYRNKVFDFVQSHGYQIKNHSIFDFEGYQASSGNFTKELSTKVMLEKSVLERVFLLDHMSEFVSGDNYRKKDLFKALQRIEQDITEAHNQPLFSYIHFLLPHAPYIFDSVGNTRQASVFLNMDDQKITANYLHQLTFCNSIIRQLVQSIKSSKRNCIIILEGDHGLRSFATDQGEPDNSYYEKENHFRNLSAYYFFDGHYENLYDSISPVNSFRMVFNQYFGCSYALLPDSSYRIKTNMITTY